MSLDKIKAMMFDVDGTLITSDYQMSEAMYQALVKLKQKGIKLALSTGRPYFSAKAVLEANHSSNELFDMFYCNNGIEIYNPSNNENVFLSYVSKEDAIKLDEYFYEDYLTLAFYSEGKYIKCAHMINNEELFEDMCKVRFVEGKIIDFKKDAEDSPKYLVLFDDKYLDKVEKKIKDLNYEGITITKSGRYCYEVVRSGNTKAMAVDHYSEVLGLKKDEILYFGDYDNDIPALIDCEGCLVGNYLDYKEYGIKYNCKSVYEDGIPEFLKQNGII